MSDEQQPRTPEQQREHVRELEREHWRQRHEIYDESDRQAITDLLLGR